MMLYVESRAFPKKTFVILCKLSDTIARARAQMLHILWELGRADHQFRFRFRGQFLRDAYTFEDYEIPENAVIKMVPMAKRQESFVDLRRMDEQDLGQGITDEVISSLEEEIQVFIKRENLLTIQQVFLWLWFLASFLSFITTFFYSGFWNIIVTYYLFKYCPTFTRTGGFVGRASQYHERYMVIYLLLSLICMIPNCIFLYLLLPPMIAGGCRGYTGSCTYWLLWSAVFYACFCIVLFLQSCFIPFIIYNFRFKAGDYVEQYLVKTRDLDKVLYSAKNGKIKEKRNAAFELASFATCSDENKHKIVAQGGIEVLSNLSLSRDESTQEYATEAIAELLTLPEIQVQFVEMDGIKTLCALLHGCTNKIIYEAATALFYLVSDSDENKAILVEDTGLDDLAHATTKDDAKIGKVIAGIFLELASFTTELRAVIASRNVVAISLVRLCQLPDVEAQQLSLQTLELIAIESPESVVTQEELLHHLIAMPRLTEDEKLYLLAGKIILYFAENQEACTELVQANNLTDTLLQFAQTNDPILQNVVGKIVLAILENRKNVRRIPDLGLDKVVNYLHSFSADRYVFDNADTALNLLTILNSQNKMGSITSLHSIHKHVQSVY